MGGLDILVFRVQGLGLGFLRFVIQFPRYSILTIWQCRCLKKLWTTLDTSGARPYTAETLL